MALPKPLNAHVKRDDLSVWADAGTSSLSRVGFLSASGVGGGLVESSAVFVPFPGSGIDGTGDGSENIKWIFDYDADFKQATVKTDTGSLTYSLTVEGTPVEGLDNQVANTTEAVDVVSPATSYTAGDEIVLAISGAVNAQGFRFGLKTQRL